MLFIICGADNENHDNVIVVELKQLDKVEKVADEMLHSVKAYTGGAVRMVFPSIISSLFIYCKCDCVNECCDVRAADLKSGNTKSCGCYQKESRGKSSLEDLTGLR